MDDDGDPGDKQVAVATRDDPAPLAEPTIDSESNLTIEMSVGNPEGASVDLSEETTSKASPPPLTVGTEAPAPLATPASIAPRRSIFVATTSNSGILPIVVHPLGSVNPTNITRVTLPEARESQHFFKPIPGLAACRRTSTSDSNIKSPPGPEAARPPPIGLLMCAPVASSSPVSAAPPSGMRKFSHPAAAAPTSTSGGGGSLPFRRSRGPVDVKNQTHYPLAFEGIAYGSRTVDEGAASPEALESARAMSLRPGLGAPIPDRLSKSKGDPNPRPKKLFSHPKYPSLLLYQDFSGPESKRTWRYIRRNRDDFTRFCEILLIYEGVLPAWDRQEEAAAATAGSNGVAAIAAEAQAGAAGIGETAASNQVKIEAVDDSQERMNLDQPDHHYLPHVSHGQSAPEENPNHHPNKSPKEEEKDWRLDAREQNQCHGDKNGGSELLLSPKERSPKEKVLQTDKPGSKRRNSSGDESRSRSLSKKQPRISGGKGATAPTNKAPRVASPHGSTGSTESSGESMFSADPVRGENDSSKDSSGQDDPEGRELYCICRQPYDEREMIGCDGCDEWFHMDCVGVNGADYRDDRDDDEEEEADDEGLLLRDKGKEWFCSNCAAKSKAQKKRRRSPPSSSVGRKGHSGKKKHRGSSGPTFGHEYSASAAGGRR